MNLDILWLVDKSKSFEIRKELIKFQLKLIIKLILHLFHSNLLPLYHHLCLYFILHNLKNWNINIQYICKTLYEVMQSLKINF